jgi:hypothetical protein
MVREHLRIIAVIEEQRLAYERVLTELGKQARLVHSKQQETRSTKEPAAAQLE